MIFINFKTYQKGTGSEALGLIKILEKVAQESQIKIIPVVQATDIKEVVQTTTLEVWTQHTDFVQFGAHTGAILPEAVFEDGAEELRKVFELKPTYVSYEPPELVGSKTTSVAQAQPEVIVKAVEEAKANDLPLVVGAGIKSAQDVRKSIEFGAVGVAVASDIVASDDPEKELKELIRGLE
ncbi:MAG: Triosephosphate isomerase [Microgenomates group bacterium GW2011_GWC1_37_8]|nr:MAG: Triosephosphate isomerase [Microgenomates group bacterium GW2011_GWC1_37_8]